MRLNLLMREMRALWASDSLGVELGGGGEWEIRWREFAGSVGVGLVGCLWLTRDTHRAVRPCIGA